MFKDSQFKLIDIASKFSYKDDLNPIGFFFIYNKDKQNYEFSSKWWAIDKCRELFGHYYLIYKSPEATDMSYVGFHWYKLNIEKFVKFWGELEDKLNLKEKSVIHSVEGRKDVMIVQLSPFWKENVTRTEFFTLFLRCGAVYYDNDFNQAFINYDLTNKNMKLVSWFLAGNTNVKYDFEAALRYHYKQGLLFQYTDVSDTTLKERLTKE